MQGTFSERARMDPTNPTFNVAHPEVWTETCVVAPDE